MDFKSWNWKGILLKDIAKTIAEKYKKKLYF